jgi:hypothetical protein
MCSHMALGLTKNIVYSWFVLFVLYYGNGILKLFLNFIVLVLDLRQFIMVLDMKQLVVLVLDLRSLILILDF